MDSYDKLMGKKLPLWLFFLIVIVGVCATILLASMVRYQITGGKKLGTFGALVLSVAEFPSRIVQVSRSLLTDHALAQAKFPGQFGLQRTAFRDTGYLLLASIEHRTGQSFVKLIRLADGKEMAHWRPDTEEIINKAPSSYRLIGAAKSALFRVQHPLLTQDGGLIFHDQEGPMVKIDRCSKLAWLLDHPFTHSNEFDDLGNVWSTISLSPSTFDHIKYPDMRDDGIAKISPDGKLLFSRSVAKILVDNDYGGLLFGAGAYDSDPVHLNEVFPVASDSPYWKKGDLILSLRHRSTVLLYRPSSNKIIWLKTGPWLNQHDGKPVGNSKISVFGNDVIRQQSEMTFARGHSTVYLYDFSTGNITLPFDKILAELNFGSATEGRSDILENGDIFVEQTNGGRIMRLAPDQVRWSYVNRPTVSDEIAILNWSRYLTASQVEPVLSNLQCHN